MRNKRLIVIAVAVVSTLLVALLVIPGFIDWSKYQQLAKDKVAAATGYDLTISGQFRAGFLPRPHLIANDIILRKPVEGKADTFVTLDGVNVTLAFWPLLVGHVNISSITLDKPTVTMVTYKDGTDNWKPKAQTQSAEVDAVTGKPIAAETSAAPAVSVGAFHIKDGHLTMRDEAKGTTQNINIPDLKLKADNMTGPFEGKGTIGYNNAEFDVDFSTGGYRAGETMPMQLNAKDTDGRAQVKFNGIVATKPGAYEVQGESGLSFNDLNGVLADAGFPIALPKLGGETSITGMLTASAARVSLTNGALNLSGGNKLTTSLDWKKSDNVQTIKASIDSDELVELDEVLKVAEKVAAENKKSDDDAKPSKEQSPSDTEKLKPLLPAKLSLPVGLTGDVTVRARGLKYKGKETGAVVMQTKFTSGNANTRMTLVAMPGDGEVAITADLRPSKPLAEGDVYTGTLVDPVIDGKIIGSVGSLKALLADWLQVVDDKILEKPGMPRRIDADIDYRIAGYNATATLNTFSLGETKVNGTVTYTQAKRPVINAKLASNVVTLPQSKATAKQAAKADGKASGGDGKKIDIEEKLEFDPPQLPFDLKFDVTLGRFVQGDLLLTDIKAAGAYDGKGISLTFAQATTKGGTLTAAGRVADLKNLSGIDAQAGLRTDDLESFYSAMTGTKLALTQKIGTFSGSVKAKGDKSKLDTAFNAQARGYTIDAAGVLDDPFNPDLPGTLNVRVRHPDFVQAVRVFSPAFGQGVGRPIDLAGQVSINGKVYDIKDLKGTLGGSDLAGDVHADLSGSIPSIKADLTSKTLGLGDFVGVKSQAPSGGSSTAQVAASTGAGRSTSHWSREAMDTGFLKAMNMDLSVKAGTLTYGSWLLTSADFKAKMADGKLTAPLNAKLYGGSLNADLSASASGDGAPLNIAFKADGKDVNIGSFMSALTASSKKKADGTGSISVDVKGSGVSSAALMSSLTGKIDVATRTLVIYGIDLDKLAANTVEAFDGGWKGVLAGVTTQGFAGGDTEFKDIDQSFALSEGNMPIKDFKLETTSSNAIIISNGYVNFANWNMDLSNQVQVTQPKDVPVIGLRLFGPLDTPQKSVNSAALDNLLKGKVSDKLGEVISDKLGEDSKAGELIGNLLGVKKKEPVIAPTTTTPSAPATTTQPVAPAPAAATTETPKAETAPSPAPTAESAPTPAEAEEPKAETAPAPTPEAPKEEEKKSDVEKGLEVLDQIMGQ